MASVLGEWRAGILYIVPLVIPICAYAIFHHPSLQSLGEIAQAKIAAIPDAQIRSQMTVPIALAVILPTGLIGLFIAAVMGGSIGTDTSQLHSWGSIFVQDVVLPLRKKPFSPEAQMRCLRLAVIFVAGFGVLDASCNPQKSRFVASCTRLGTSVGSMPDLGLSESLESAPILRRPWKPKS